MSDSMLTPPYFIELLTRDNDLKTRHRFAQLPIRIGRGYDNDLILDDPYIAPNHAIIERIESGAVQIRDLDSENGIVSQGKRQANIPIEHNVIRLGHTNMRFRDASFTVAKTLTDNASHGWEGWPPAIVGLLMLTLSALVSTWLTPEKFSIINAITVVALLLVVVMIWSGGWALATRMMTGGSARLGRHIFIAACAAILSDCWELLSVMIAYAFSLEFFTLYGSHMSVIITAGMLFFHLMTVNRQHPKRLVTTCVFLAVLGSSFILISNYQRSGKLADNLYMSYLLPPALRISGNETMDQFISSANALKPKLDETRKQPANSNSRGLDY